MKKHGPNLHQLLMQEELNGIIPKALKDRPVISWQAGRFLDAFVVLANQSEGRINLSEIKAYCDMAGETDQMCMVSIITYVDSAVRKKDANSPKMSIKDGRVI